MPRQQNNRGGGRGRGGGGGGFRGGSRGGSRGGGSRGGGFRGAGRGRGGGAIRKPTNGGPPDRFKKFKHIQRNQEAEEQLRQRQGLEREHSERQQREKRLRDADLESDEEEEEEAVDPMEQLLTSLAAQTKQLKKGGAKQKSKAIESSDSEMSGVDEDDDDDDDSDDEMDEEGNEEEQDSEEEAEDEEDSDDSDAERIADPEGNSDIDVNDEDDDSASSDDDFQINEQFEQQAKRKSVPSKPAAKSAQPEEDDGDDVEEEEDEEEDSDDDDQDLLLQPEEVRKQKTTKKPIEEFVDSNDDDEDEEELDEEEDSETTTNVAADMFSAHLDHELSPALLECVSTTHSSTKHELVWPVLGRLQLDIPNADAAAAPTAAKRSKKAAVSLLDADASYAPEGSPPGLFDHRTVTLQQLGIKSQMHVHFASANAENLQQAAGEESAGKLVTPLQAELLSVLANYQDLYFPGRTHANAEELRFAYCAHALNHILKTRTKILHHNAKLTRAQETGTAQPGLVPDDCRDQGLFRPKVLIVAPFRESARRCVHNLIGMMFPERGERVQHLQRFDEEFGGEGLYFPKRNPKPEDYERTFAGNSDDTFRIGVCLTRKSIKLYADFYSSDILIVSPLGLRMVVGAAGEKERDYDFLASIEMLVLDQAELFVAQNWDHLLHVLDHVHLQPQSARNTDFSRVRTWCLNGWTRFYRQTLLFSSHELPEFRALFNGRCANYRGKVRVANPVLSGAIRHVALPVAQVFHRVEVASIQTSFDQRFAHFVQHVLPQFKAAAMAHCCVVVPSYFDFVRLRNYFKKESLSTVQICEYTKEGKMARSRDMFFHSGAHFLLYSERAHFFRRTRVKGIRHLIFYQPPTWPGFYAELVNLLQEAYQNPRDGAKGTQTVTVLYTKYDMLQVAAVVGTERAAKMAAAEKTTHVFMTGE